MHIASLKLKQTADHNLMFNTYLSLEPENSTLFNSNFIEFSLTAFFKEFSIKNIKLGFMLYIIYFTCQELGDINVLNDLKLELFLTYSNNLADI